MTEPDTLARNRWLAMIGVRFAATATAVLGVIVLGKGITLPERMIGLALTVMSMWVIVTVPKAMAARWRTPPEDAEGP